MVEILNNLLRSEKGILRLKDEVGNSIKRNYEICCGELTGRMGSGRRQSRGIQSCALHCLMGYKGLKGAKAKHTS